MEPSLRPEPADLVRFEELLDRCERVGRARLALDELRTLARLYRLNAAALARERQRGDDPEATRYLNALCVRAYTALHVRVPGDAPPPRTAALLDALARTFRHQVAAWALLLAGGVLGALVATGDPSAVPALLPASLGYSQSGSDALVTSPEERARFLAREETPSAQKALFGTWLFAHNSRVALTAFATGILAGVPTVLLQLYNGLVLGVFSWVFLRDPDPLPFLAWILPHGIPELTAITLCAAGGLALGEAVAAPGRLGRRRALRAAQGPALLLFALALPLLLLAAGVESFVRESALSTATRLGVALGEAVGLAGGLVALRRLARRRAPDADWLRDLAPAVAPVPPEGGAEGHAPARSAR